MGLTGNFWVESVASPPIMQHCCVLVGIIIVENDLYDGWRFERFSICVNERIYVSSEYLKIVCLEHPSYLCPSAGRPSLAEVLEYALDCTQSYLSGWLSVCFVLEPWLFGSKLSHTTDLVREERAATRRAKEFSSINGNLEIFFCLHWEVSCAASQKKSLCRGNDPR
jgi:hypothetical protein